MDPATELASHFTVGRYQALRDILRADTAHEQSWQELLDAFERRINERFLQPVAVLDASRERRMIAGFAILAIDCLLIDTIQSFREGRATTGEVSSAHSFKRFLSSSCFSDWNRLDRDEFFHYVRNGLLHNGETRGGWKLRTNTNPMVLRDQTTGTRTINRRRFHEAIAAEFADLLARLREGTDTTLREHFLRRMDATAGIPAPARPHAYFAYGSNMDPGELGKTAPDEYGVAFLPGYRLSFTKHAKSRGGDAATITPDAGHVVWGFVYRLNGAERKAFGKREAGYAEQAVTVYLQSPTPEDDPTPVHVFTYIAKEPCTKNCGVPPDYLRLVTNACRKRGLPAEYTNNLDDRGCDRQEPGSSQKPL